MRIALLNYLEQRPAETSRDTLAELRSARSSIDPDGVLRIGSWLLEARSDHLALTQGQRTGAGWRFEVASLNQTPEGHWVVTDLSTEHALARGNTGPTKPGTP